MLCALAGPRSGRTQKGRSEAVQTNKRYKRGWRKAAKRGIETDILFPKKPPLDAGLGFVPHHLFYSENTIHGMERKAQMQFTFDRLAVPQISNVRTGYDSFYFSPIIL